MNISPLKNSAVLALLILSLCGCNDTESSKASGSSTTSLSQVKEGQAAIELPQGAKVGLDGKLVKSFILENKNGKFQRQVIDLPSELMSVEGSLYYNLAKIGYARKVKSEKQDVYLLSYVKKNQTPVHASLKTLKSQKNNKKHTRLVLTWKLDDATKES